MCISICTAYVLHKPSDPWPLSISLLNSIAGNWKSLVMESEVDEIQKWSKG